MNNFINNFINNEFKHSLQIKEEEIKDLNLFENFLKNLKGYKQSFYFNDNVYKIEFMDITTKEFKENSILIDRILRRFIK